MKSTSITAITTLQRQSQSNNRHQNDGIPASVPLLVLFVTSVLVFSRFVVVNVVFVTEGTSTDDDVDDDDCSASPLHFSACSLDFCHI